jgi:EAL domain-containing protein (putative c-di-GMP-specific phosphodiesterase class I)
LERVKPHGFVVFSVGSERIAMTKCLGCQDGEPLGFDFDMAFQPIVDAARQRVWGYEALVRGLNGEAAFSILSGVTETNRYKFDQLCRVKAIEKAAERFDRADLVLSINFLPNAVYEPAACIRATLAAANRTGFDRSRLMFEFTENEPMRDTAHIGRILAAYRDFGFLTALDDFGAGYAGLGLLAKFQPDLIKIDMEVLRGVDDSKPRQAIVRGLTSIASDLGIQVLAEGVETEAEFKTLTAIGIRLFQGYYFGRPHVGSIRSDAFVQAA